MPRVFRFFPLLPVVLAGCADSPTLHNVKAGSNNADGPATIASSSSFELMTHAEAQQAADDFLAASPKFTEGIDKLVVMETEVDSRGLGHVRYGQHHAGVPVFDGEAYVHTDANGLLYRSRDALVRGIVVDPVPAFDAAAATGFAMAQLEPTVQEVELPTAELVVLRHAGRDHLTWKVQLYVEDAQGVPSRPLSFVDAHRLERVHGWDNLAHASLSDSDKVTYDNRNSTRTNRARVGDSSDSDLNTTHSAVGTTLSFFSANFGRDSYDGNGAKVKSYGHYGRNTVNAYWDGSRLLIGDGDGYTSDYLGVLDITAHEFGHAVTDYEANLTYSYESGALNEAASDILAASVEAYVDGSTGQDTWDVGEDCWLSDRALRFMQSPSDDGSSRDHYSNRYTGSSDYGGVHWNSGIANHFFYLLVEGGSHHDSTYASGNTVTGIGIDDAYAIWYEALTNYMTSSTDFSDARTDTEDACAALGYSATACESVSYAWYEVGVGSNPGSGSGSTGGGSTGGGSGGDTGTTDTGTTDTGTTDTGTSGSGCDTGFTEITGSLSSGADDQYSYTTSSSGLHDFALSGPSGTDFDLYLHKKKGKNYRQVDSSTVTGSTEAISYSDGQGDYIIQVKSYSGSGNYSLCYKIPS